MKTVGTVHVKDANEILMTELGRNSRLAQKSLDRFSSRRVGSSTTQIWEETLQGHIEVEIDVPSSIDRPHSSLAELLVKHALPKSLVSLNQRNIAEERVLGEIAGASHRWSSSG
jgi:hypothetical protein